MTPTEHTAPCSSRRPRWIWGGNRARGGQEGKGMGKGQEEGRDEAGEVEGYEGKGRGYDYLDNSPMLAGL